MTRYSIEVHHGGLGKYRIISGNDRALVEAKASALQRTWNYEHERKQTKQRELDAKRQKLEHKRQNAEENRQEAEQRTAQAKAEIEHVQNILSMEVNVNGPVDWEDLKEKAAYSTPKPTTPTYKQLPHQPQPDDPNYKPNLTLLDRVFKSMAKKKIDAACKQYSTDHELWVATVTQIEAKNKKLQLEYTANVEHWNVESSQYQQAQARQNETVEKLRSSYEAGQLEAITDYCEIVLTNSEYHEDFPKEFNFEYIAETKILIVDYSLPAPENLPNLKEVKYVKTKDELVEVLLSEKEQNKIYDIALYQICLRSLYQLFAADKINALDAIAFNGWVKSIDKAKGKETNGCIISIQVTKTELQDIDLKNVDAKACFKALKGIGSSQLHSLTPIAPVLNISHEDERFISSHEVTGQIDERFNLAAMDWDEFEQLVRELFEKEFYRSGGEVKVTRASRDGGVDAVAFDPDPIHGGKIVIQAKRYTNTVGVAFVRELWGTVMNEGAMKGILITTADYGPDAYEFIKGKPLVLMNGNSLLYLLEKHGHKAKIDIKEAKMILGERGASPLLVRTDKE